MHAWQRFQLGDESPDTLAALRADFAKYLANRDGLPLHTVLRVGTPLQARTALRDELLRRAAALQDAPTAWRRAVALHRAWKDLAPHWPRWASRGAPPDDATALQALLFAARCYGTFPKTAEGFLGLLS